MLPSPSSRNKLPTDPSQLPASERDYYRTVWGFDPVDDCQTISLLMQRYEACFDLPQDLPLQAARVVICARVDWKGEVIHNRIVFRKGAKEAAVDCTHTIVYAGPASGVMTFASDADLTQNDLPELVKLARTGRLVLLPPWEHFAALKSYVAAIAQEGLLTMVRSANARAGEEGPNGTLEVPFGFNPAMQGQIFKVLTKVIPSVTSAMQEDLARELLEDVPPAWIFERWEILDPIYNFRALFIKEGGLFLAWIQSLMAAFPSLFLPSPLNLQIRGIIERDWESVVRTWPPAVFANLCRKSNLLDGIMEMLFENGQCLIRARELAPSQEWNQLFHEWDAGHFSYDPEEKFDEYKHYGSLKVLDQEFSKKPPYEVWPRSELCSVRFPPMLTLLDQKEKTPAANHQRLDAFTQQYQKYRKGNPDAIVDYSFTWIKDKSIQSVREFWRDYYQQNESGRKQDQQTKSTYLITDIISLQDLRTRARDPRMPIEILQNLASHWDLAIRLSVASHPHADKDLLERMKADIQPSVRAVVEARNLRDGTLILPLPGELLSPGELLWLLVQNEGECLMFGISEEGNKRQEYSAWLTRQGQSWSRRTTLPWKPFILGNVIQCAYWRGFLIVPEERGVEFINIAQNGFGSLLLSEFPVISLGSSQYLDPLEIKDRSRLSLLLSFL